MHELPSSASAGKCMLYEEHLDRWQLEPRRAGRTWHDAPGMVWCITCIPSCGVNSLTGEPFCVQLSFSLVSHYPVEAAVACTGKVKSSSSAHTGILTLKRSNLLPSLHWSAEEVQATPTGCFSVTQQNTYPMKITSHLSALLAVWRESEGRWW